MIHGGDKLLHKVAAHAGRQVLLALYLALQHISVEVWRREDDTVEVIFSSDLDHASVLFLLFLLFLLRYLPAWGRSL